MREEIGYNDFPPAIRLLHRFQVKEENLKFKYSKDWELIMNSAAKFYNLSSIVKDKVQWQKHVDDIELAISTYNPDAAFWAVVAAVNWFYTDKEKDEL